MAKSDCVYGCGYCVTATTRPWIVYPTNALSTPTFMPVFIYPQRATAMGWSFSAAAAAAGNGGEGHSKIFPFIKRKEKDAGAWKVLLLIRWRCDLKSKLVFWCWNHTAGTWNAKDELTVCCVTNMFVSHQPKGHKTRKNSTHGPIDKRYSSYSSLHHTTSCNNNTNLWERKTKHAHSQLVGLLYFIFVFLLPFFHSFLNTFFFTGAAWKGC